MKSMSLPGQFSIKSHKTVMEVGRIFFTLMRNSFYMFLHFTRGLLKIFTGQKTLLTDMFLLFRGENQRTWFMKDPSRGALRILYRYGRGTEHFWYILNTIKNCYQEQKNTQNVFFYGCLFLFPSKQEKLNFLQVNPLSIQSLI